MYINRLIIENVMIHLKMTWCGSLLWSTRLLLSTTMNWMLYKQRLNADQKISKKEVKVTSDTYFIFITSIR